jgi:hypothetical protein
MSVSPDQAGNESARPQGGQALAVSGPRDGPASPSSQSVSPAARVNFILLPEAPPDTDDPLHRVRARAREDSEDRGPVPASNPAGMTGVVLSSGGLFLAVAAFFASGLTLPVAAPLSLAGAACSCFASRPAPRTVGLVLAAVGFVLAVLGWLAVAGVC